MARILYLGDETTAAGLRLAGVETHVVAPAEAETALEQALAGDDECVLLSGALAAAVTPARLAEALAGHEPLFAIVPDVLGRYAPPDVAVEVRTALGIEA